MVSGSSEFTNTGEGIMAYRTSPWMLSKLRVGEDIAFEKMSLPVWSLKVV